MELFYTKPNDVESRSNREARVYDLLDELGIEYARVDHEKADDMDACKEIEGVLGTEICKNLFLCNRQKTDFYLLMMQGDKPFKTKDITKQLGCSRLSFASAEFMLELLDIMPGSVSVLGLMNDKDVKIQLVMDKPIFEGEYIGCHPCENTSSLKIKTSDILEKFLPRVNHDVIVVDLPAYDDLGE